MTVPATAPATIRELERMLEATAAWGAVAASGSVHYPKAEPRTDSLPIAVIDEQSASSSRVAEGSPGVISGEMSITIHAELRIPELESLARDIRNQLLDQQTGLFLNSVDPGQSDDIDTAARSDGNQFRTIVLSVSHGLSA